MFPKKQEPLGRPPNSEQTKAEASAVSILRRAGIEWASRIRNYWKWNPIGQIEKKSELVSWPQLIIEYSVAWNEAAFAFRLVYLLFVYQILYQSESKLIELWRRTTFKILTLCIGQSVFWR